jgi:hypothetical protein
MVLTGLCWDVAAVLALVVCYTPASDWLLLADRGLAEQQAAEALAQFNSSSGIHMLLLAAHFPWLKVCCSVRYKVWLQYGVGNSFSCINGCLLVLLVCGATV